ncbi:MAG: formylglycine-generating enzyme family protein [Jatrophihabitans sp.]
MTTSNAPGRPVIDDLPSFADVPAGLQPAMAEDQADQPAEPTAGFGLAVFPTTVGQYWHYLLDQDLHRAPAPRLHGFPPAAGTGLRSTPSGALVLDEQLATLPVTGVSWHGALAYCRWLSDRTGRRCRLPAAVEWQYAAAGPAGWHWALGAEFDRKTYAPAATGPRPVGAAGPSPYGLHDLTGNVFEWCADALSIPGAADSGSRVIKGGAYTVRNPESFDNATVFTADELSTVPYIGFRVLAAAG